MKAFRCIFLTAVVSVFAQLQSATASTLATSSHSCLITLAQYSHVASTVSELDEHAQAPYVHDVLLNVTALVESFVADTDNPREHFTEVASALFLPAEMPADAELGAVSGIASIRGLIESLSSNARMYLRNHILDHVGELPTSPRNAMADVHAVFGGLFQNKTDIHDGVGGGIAHFVHDGLVTRPAHFIRDEKKNVSRLIYYQNAEHGEGNKGKFLTYEMPYDIEGVQGIFMGAENKIYALAEHSGPPKRLFLLQVDQGKAADDAIALGSDLDAEYSVVDATSVLFTSRDPKSLAQKILLHPKSGLVEVLEVPDDFKAFKASDVAQIEQLNSYSPREVPFFYSKTSGLVYYFDRGRLVSTIVPEPKFSAVKFEHHYVAEDKLLITYASGEGNTTLNKAFLLDFDVTHKRFANSPLPKSYVLPDLPAPEGSEIEKVRPTTISEVKIASENEILLTTRAYNEDNLWYGGALVWDYTANELRPLGVAHQFVNVVHDGGWLFIVGRHTYGYVELAAKNEISRIEPATELKGLPNEKGQTSADFFLNKEENLVWFDPGLRQFKEVQNGPFASAKITWVAKDASLITAVSKDGLVHLYLHKEGQVGLHELLAHAPDTTHPISSTPTLVRQVSPTLAIVRLELNYKPIDGVASEITKTHKLLMIDSEHQAAKEIVSWTVSKKPQDKIFHIEVGELGRQEIFYALVNQKIQFYRLFGDEFIDFVPSGYLADPGTLIFAATPTSMDKVDGLLLATNSGTRIISFKAGQLLLGN